MNRMTKNALKILAFVPLLFSCSDRAGGSSEGASYVSPSYDLESGAGMSSEDASYVRPSYDLENRDALKVDDDNYRNFYHIWVPSFADSDGDGIGDLGGILAKLDYLRKKGDPHGEGSLGVDGILLSPVFESTQYHAYDTIDYYTVKKEFGTNAQLEKLIEECHGRGMKILLDMALNHASVKNEMFLTAVNYISTHGSAAVFNSDGSVSESAAAECPELTYFRIFKSGTNIQALTGYSNGTYYCPGLTKAVFEGFSSDMPDWNLDLEFVRNYQKEVLEHYLDLGIDGFRLDAVTSYYTGLPKKNYEYINLINSEVKAKKSGAYIVAEGPWSFSGAIGYVQNTSIDSYFDFDCAIRNVSSSGISGFLNRISNNGNMDGAVSYLATYLGLSGREAEQNPAHIDANFNSNHDIGRMTNQFIRQGEFKKDAAKFFYAMQNLYQGNYFNYYGDEIGVMGVTSSSAYGDRLARLPMRWGDSYECAPYTEGANDKFDQYIKDTADVQIGDSSSLFNYMRCLYKMKDDNPEIARAPLEVEKVLKDQDVLSVKKTWNGSTIHILVNASSQQQTVTEDALGFSGELRNCLSVDGSYSYKSGEGLILPSLSVTVIK